MYLRTVTFRASEGVCDRSEVRVTAYDTRERITATATQMGRAAITLEQLRSEGGISLLFEMSVPL